MRLANWVWLQDCPSLTFLLLLLHHTEEPSLSNLVFYTLLPRPLAIMHRTADAMPNKMSSDKLAGMWVATRLRHLER